MTYGRSGTTLLQGILNSIPGYLIRGENRWAPYHLYQFHQVCSAARDGQYSRGHRLGPDHPWFGMDDFPLEAALSYQRTLVLETLLRPRRTTRVAGFKEIMWASGDYETFVDEGYIDYLIALFPDARFLINTRDLDATLRSGWWPNRPDGRAQLTRADRQVRVSGSGHSISTMTTMSATSRPCGHSSTGSARTSIPSRSMRSCAFDTPPDPPSKGTR